ncbi:protein RRP6-like 2 [Silene latifolia]|uniref:protein RRP6-like 2 n=1 Tax=Silene latifolia TaxID=37657 RepID=UPI003D780776
MATMSMSIPFHVPNIPKPQDIYSIKPDNSNTTRFVVSQLPNELTHYPASDLVDQPPHPNKPIIKPGDLDTTPFTYVDTVQGLECLRSKLEVADEFAVDLEANNYRSFQGLTCLMQISTRTEDFVVDTLKLYHFIGQYLGAVFLDPKKRKIMHGAGNDVLWLQRDFGIFVCNLFDTMQASRVLKMERNSLAHLLVYFCGVSANKQFQTSDWRIRPLPREMLHYAREDTHYLLYIYDKMRSQLVAGCGSTEYDDPLLEVYSRSHNVCKSLYKKELFNEDSYKKLFGLGDAGLDSDQTNVAARLCKCRDRIARDKDESTGYVLPNKLLIELCQKLPRTESEFLAIAEAHNCQNHPLILDNIGELLKIIGNLDSNQNVAQIDYSKQKGMPEDANTKQSHLEMQYMYQMNRPQGYYVTAVYPQPQACYVNVVYPPGYYISAKHPELMNPVYCTVPQYYQYQIC